MRKKWLLIVALLAVCLALPWESSSDAWAAQTASQPLRGITRPRREVTISFVRPGRVAELLIARGDAVKADAVIARQDDSVEQAALEADKADAEDDTELMAEKAVLDKDLLDLEKLRQFGTEWERRDAELKVRIDEARIKLAEAKLKKAAIKLRATQAEIDRLSARHSKEFDGIVAELYLRQGETADGQNMKVARIVQIDPLWVEVPVKILQARALKEGDPAQVTFSDRKVRSGKVDEKSILANPASDEILVRIEVPNPERLEPGENVFVQFGPAPAVAAGQP